MSDSESSAVTWPIYLFDETVRYPDRGNYYLIAGNGTFLHKDNGSFVALVPVDKISFLPDLKETSFLKWNLPKIPAEIVYQIKFFFAAVFQRYKAEAVVNLFYNFTAKEWKVEVTEQYVSRGGVKYQRKAATAGSSPLTVEQASKTGINDLQKWIRIGTIHSHCDFNAYHSPTDVQDEEDFDGLHCTFGYVNKDDFKITASVVSNGFRQKINPMIVMEGLEEAQDAKELYSLKGIDIQNDEILQKWFVIIDEWLDSVIELKPEIEYNPNAIIYADPNSSQVMPEEIEYLNDDDDVSWDVEYSIQDDEDGLEWLDEDEEEDDDYEY